MGGGRAVGVGGVVVVEVKQFCHLCDEINCEERGGADRALRHRVEAA